MNRQLPYSQAWLLKIIELLGYPIEESGVCRGVAFTSVLQFLFTDLMEFDNFLYEVYKSSQEELTQAYYPFLDCICLLQAPQSFRYLFESEELYQPDHPAKTMIEPEMKREDERATLVDAFSGCYQMEELKEFFKLFKAINICSFSLLLSSSNHSISVHHHDQCDAYNLVDANKLPSQSFFSTEDLSRAVIDAFKAGKEGNDIAIFSTQVYVKKAYQHSFLNKLEQKKSTEVWARLHDPNKAHMMQTDAFGATWFYIACGMGQVHCASALTYQDEYFINGTESSDVPPLYIACQNGYAHIVSLLLSFSELNVNRVRLKNGATPLIAAAYGGHTAVVKLLLSHPDIDVLAKTNDGHCAEEYAKREDIKKLIRSKSRQQRWSQMKRRWSVGDLFSKSNYVQEEQRCDLFRGN